MTVKKKKDIKPPSPVMKTGGVRNEARDVEQRPTVQETDPNYGSDVATDKTRVDFDDSKFIAAIRQKGYFVRWRKAMICVCQNPETEQTSMRGVCDICDGSGYFYIDPQEIQAIMTNFSKQSDIYQRAGRWMSGESAITVEPQYKIGYRDSIEMLDAVAVFNEWITKGNRRGIRSKLPDGVDSARYRIKNINALFYADSNRTPVRLSEELHYTIDANGWIKWTSEGNKVPDGTVFSIHYDFHPVYVVTSHPHQLRDTVSKTKKKRQTVVRLPVQARVMLDYLHDPNTVLPTTSVC
jgi:hypothetical protein